MSEHGLSGKLISDCDGYRRSVHTPQSVWRFFSSEFRPLTTDLMTPDLSGPLEISNMVLVGKSAICY